MFPLGTVLFPSAVLPLHVFEERYRVMVRHLVSGEVEPEFGVVLIERGSEVGGDDTRTTVGTVARILEAAELPDGRWAMVTFGVARLRVHEWLSDDPYPRALVVDDPDAPASPGADARWAAMQPAVRRVLGMAAELGVATVPATLELADAAGLGGFQAGAAIPIGPLDAQHVLEAPGPDERLDLLDGLLAEQAELLEARLRLG
jgi:Lon protease-like protein